MSKQDWLDYFEAVNGRSVVQKKSLTLAAGEFQEEVVVPETPQTTEFVPNCPCWRTSSSSTSPRVCCSANCPCWRTSSSSHKPQSLLAPTAPVEEPVAAPQAPEFVAAPAAPAAPEFVAANCTCRRTSCSSSSRTGSSSCFSEWTCFPTSSTASLPTTDSSSLSTSSFPRTNRTSLSCPTKSIWCCRWWLLGIGFFQLWNVQQL